MSEISFEEPTISPQAQPATAKGGAISKLVQKWKLAKDDVEAQRVLLIIAAMAIIIAIALPFMFGSHPKPAMAPLLPPTTTHTVTRPGPVVPAPVR